MEQLSSVAEAATEHECVKVAVRVRPLLPREVNEGASTCVSVDEELACVALGRDRRLTYDYAFSQHCKQERIFQTCVQPLVDAFISGYNATVMAYGQTGSGKTYTMGMESSAAEMGVTPRVVQYLFSSLEQGNFPKGQTSAPAVSITLLEIYNEDVRDLLAPTPTTPAAQPKALVLREGPTGAVSVAGAREVPVRSAQELLTILGEALAARSTSQTSMNEVSSRSHAICTILLRQPTPPTPRGTQRGSDTDTLSHTHSLPGDDTLSGLTPQDKSVGVIAKLHLVDLAGSERTKRSTAAAGTPRVGSTMAHKTMEAAAARFREAVNINQGLLALGNVISALGDKKRWNVTHIPYRDSKLTRLLQDSLGGRSFTMLLACVSPADDSLEESLSTLKYAHRARNIRNRPLAPPSQTRGPTDPLTASQTEVRTLQIALLRKLLAAAQAAGTWVTPSQRAVLEDMHTVLAAGGELTALPHCEEALITLGGLQLRLMTSDQQPTDTDMGNMGGHGVDGQGMGCGGVCGEDNSGVCGDPRDSEIASLRAQLEQVTTELNDARQDLAEDERIFVEQQRELRAAQQTIALLTGGAAQGADMDGVVVVGSPTKHNHHAANTNTKPPFGGPQHDTDDPAQPLLQPQAERSCDSAISSDSVAAPGGDMSHSHTHDSEGEGDAETGTETDAQLALQALMDGVGIHERASGVSGVGGGSGVYDDSVCGEEDVLVGEVEERSCEERNGEGSRVSSHSAGVSSAHDADRESLLAELSSLQQQCEALERERAAAEQAAHQQHADFAAVRDILEERMQHLTGAIASQEAMIEALTTQEAQARELTRACMERMACLEEEILSKESEVRALREALCQLEGDLETRTKEEREEMRRQCERDIAKAQAQIKSLRRALQEAHRQQVDRDSQRSAARVQTLEAELKVLRSEQEALRKRLTERITVQERQARAHAQEMTLLRRAAHQAQQRMVSLLEETRAARAMAKAKTQEAEQAQRRLRHLQDQLDGRIPSPATTPQAAPRTGTPAGAQRTTPTGALRDSISGRTIHPAPWCSSSKRTPASTPKGGATPASARLLFGRGGPYSPSPNNKPTVTVPTGSMYTQGVNMGQYDINDDSMIESESASVDVRELIDNHLRALAAKHAAEVRLRRLFQRQQELTAQRADLNLQRAEVAAALQMARAAADAAAGSAAGATANSQPQPGQSTGGVSGGGFKSRYAECEDDGLDDNEGVCRGNGVGGGGKVGELHMALSDVDERLDGVCADSAYVDMVIREMQKVLERAEGCGLELRRRLARMSVSHTRAALSVALEQLSAAQCAYMQPKQEGASPGMSAPALRPTPTKAPATLRSRMSKVSQSQPHLPASPHRRPTLLESPSPNRLTASTDLGSERPPLRQSLFLVSASLTGITPQRAMTRPSIDVPASVTAAAPQAPGAPGALAATAEPPPPQAPVHTSVSVVPALPPVTVPTALDVPSGTTMALESACGAYEEGAVASSDSRAAMCIVAETTPQAPTEPTTDKDTTGAGAAVPAAMATASPRTGVPPLRGLSLSPHGSLSSPRNLPLTASRLQRVSQPSSPFTGADPTAHDDTHTVPMGVSSPAGKLRVSESRPLRSPSLKGSLVAPTLRVGTGVAGEGLSMGGVGSPAAQPQPQSLLELCSRLLAGDE